MAYRQTGYTARISAIGTIAFAMVMTIAGCQSTPSASAPMPSATPPSASPAATSAPTNPRALSAEAQAQQQAKAIDELLAARTQADAQDRGLTIVEPAKASQTPPVPVPAPAEKELPPIPPPPVAKPPVRPPSVASSDGVMPAPTIPKVDEPPVPAGVSFTPASGNAVANAALNPAQGSAAAPVMSSGGASSASPPPIQMPQHAQAPDTLETQIAQRASEYPRDVAAQLDNQVLGFLKDQPTDASSLGQLPAEDREIVTAIIDGLTNFRTGVRNDNNMLMNRKIRPLVEMADRLKSRADLAILNAQLCTMVKGFGAYTPFDPARLVFGQPRQLAVYCEVENFSSQYDDKNMWTTKLQMDLVLYTNGGMDVWHQRGIAVNDSCRNRRHDFFIAAPITLPAGLAIDQYSLKVSITDLNANRVAETTVPVGVVAAQK